MYIYTYVNEEYKFGQILAGYTLWWPGVYSLFMISEASQRSKTKQQASFGGKQYVVLGIRPTTNYYVNLSRYARSTIYDMANTAAQGTGSGIARTQEIHDRERTNLVPPRGTFLVILPFRS